MEPTRDIPKELLNNASDFNNSFFKRFKLRKGDKPLIMDNGVVKDYLFPTFYGNVTCAMAIFFCSYDKVEKLVQERLGSMVKPVKMGKGRSLIAFSNYEYKKVLGVRPYNEIATAIPVMVNPGINNPPVLPMVMNCFKHFGYYIADMPVTSEENTQRGHKIWGLPKTTRTIDIYHENNNCFTEAKEADGSTYLKIRVPKIGKAEDFDVSSYLYSHHEGRMKRSQTNFKGTFQMNKHLNLLFKKGVVPETPYLEIGNTELGHFYKNLEIEPHPFQLRYAENLSSCFDLAEQKVPSWFPSGELKGVKND